MSDGQPQSERLAEVMRLATSLAYRVLNTQLIGSPVPPYQANALVEAARLLHENGVDWPPGVTEALRRLTEAMKPALQAANEPESEETLARDDHASPNSMSRGHKVKRFIKSFRKRKG
ncbi:hypothetical protein [Methylobacterium sp. Leaf117]|uniref:hypothetical protein n=1 Tax=Methylobacterium sp. Leaf117 TaxID=1736260 RepID=UPI0012E23877|nr:hypothetical protein [Methylobacterium sp. Leaf117]